MLNKGKHLTEIAFIRYEFLVRISYFMEIDKINEIGVLVVNLKNYTSV